MAGDQFHSSRREFLTGRAVRKEAEKIGEATADAWLRAREGDAATMPAGGDRLHLATRAMNCEFAVVLNPERSESIPVASEALDLVHRLESQMTVYRADSELSRLNAHAASEAVAVEPRLFALLCEARRLAEETEGAFDPTMGPLIELWRHCRAEGRIPTTEEIAAVRPRVGIGHVIFNEEQGSVRFDRAGVELNLGAIGKGHAVDRACERLATAGIEAFLLHGGQSSVRAAGSHHGTGGWPIGVRNPIFPTETLATLLLRDGALSTSGAGEQFYRHEGRRYGHLLDPRTGWPAEGAVSVTVMAETAAEADALSTAFFVGGVEIARRYCDNHQRASALFIPPPTAGRTLEIQCLNVPEGALYPARGCLVTPI